VTLKCCGPNDIAGLAVARVVKFCTQVDYIKFQSKDGTSAQKGRS